MQTATTNFVLSSERNFFKGTDQHLLRTSPASKHIVITGWRQKLIQRMIWTNILAICIKNTRGFASGIKAAKKLKQLRDKYRNEQKLTKYHFIDNKIYHSYNSPGWPSPAFNRYITHIINKQELTAPVSLHTLIFAITKKCGFNCEHCCEWENLNKPEKLSKDDLLQIVLRFYELGISQLQLSGGEPFNRFDEIIYILSHKPKGLDCWIYTTGYQLNPVKARELKKHGLKGISLSIDHHNAVMHDRFRGKPGSFERAIHACHYATAAGLAVTFSICATKEFISEENLMAYATLAKEHGASFIQILEPKAVGHYADMDVTLKKPHWEILESFYHKMNYDSEYASFPTVTYHGNYSRKVGCAGSGKDYLYVDTDGEVHNCPFCQRKLFSALHDELENNVAIMRASGCGLIIQ